jgi:hypothetical protein
VQQSNSLQSVINLSVFVLDVDVENPKYCL